jgi:hypothetical protein
MGTGSWVITFKAPKFKSAANRTAGEPATYWFANYGFTHAVLTARQSCRKLRDSGLVTRRRRLTKALALFAPN